MKTVFRYFIGSLIIGCLLGACSKHEHEHLPSRVLHIATPAVDLTHLMEKAGPSVVGISAYYVNQSKDDFSQFEEPQEHQIVHSENFNGGSGIILDKEGDIITNAHVVEGSNAIKVTLMDKRVYMAKVIGSDSVSDLVLLKINAKDLTPITIGDVRKVKVGQWVAALGAPFGFQFSLTSGIVSAKNRTIAEDNSTIPFIQTDAAINEGNSGGPLLNLAGEVIGVNTQIYSRSGGFVGIAFAIPIDIVMDVASQLKVNGKVQRAQLGVKVDGLSQELASTFGRDRAEGALVLDILDGQEAKKQLHVGDIILEINGQPIHGPEDLPRVLNLIRPYENIPLYVWREGHGLKVYLRLNPREDLAQIRNKIILQNQTHTFDSQGEVTVAEYPGIGLKNVNRQTLAYYHLDSGMQIATISQKAESFGFALGDVIVKVGNYKITSAEDLEAALEHQENVPIFLIRNYQPIFIPYLGKKNRN